MSRLPWTRRPAGRRRAPRRLVLVLVAALGVGVIGLLTAAGTVEPAGERGAAGSTGAPGGPLRVVGVGDSVTAGTACGCVDFVRLYAEGLTARGTAATASNLGIPGLTSAQLLDAVERPGALRQAVSGGDVLLLTIGANDLEPQLQRWQGPGCPAACWSPAVARVAANVGAIVRTARSLHGNAPPRVLVTGYWNVFDDGDEAAAKGAAYLAWSDGLSRALNAALCSAARGAGATCVDLYTPFKGDGGRNPTALLAPDGDHPNAAGHRLIAGALLAASGR